MKKYLNPNEYGNLLFDKNEINAVSEVIESGKIFRYSDDKTSIADKFESMLKNMVKTNYALGVNNGTSGLITALSCLDLKNNDRVLVSSYTFLATALAVKAFNATPIPIEIDLNLGLDLEDLEEELKKGCKAVIVVQLQGRCFDLEKVKNLVHKYNAILIEDSCQALGAKNKTKYAGTIGDIGVYSFQQFKQLSCGEGGAVVTDSEQLYTKMRNYVDMGAERDLFPSWNGDTVLFGQNYRIDNIKSAIICEQLKKFDNIIKLQTDAREYIMKNINSKNIHNSVYPEGDTGMNIILLLDNETSFEKLKEKADSKDIEIRKMWNGLYFDNNLFKKNKLDDFSLRGKALDKTRNIISRMAVISIPPTITNDTCNTIIKLINEV